MLTNDDYILLGVQQSMYDSDIINISAREFKNFIAQHKEQEYVIVDVRQPEEYSENHIPGARLIPLPVLHDHFKALPNDRDVVFYCRTGNRSAVAGTFWAESEYPRRAIYNLTGGITAWTGKTLTSVPRLDIFAKSTQFADMLYQAMELEKGAENFYRHLQNHHSAQPWVDVFNTLALAETGHAKLIFKYWRQEAPTNQTFADFYAGLKGDILESGESLQSMIDRVADMQGDLCLNLMDVALNVEYAAYDLHRSIADLSNDDDTRDAFISIAQAEKNHMRTIARTIAQCADYQTEK